MYTQFRPDADTRQRARERISGRSSRLSGWVAFVRRIPIAFIAIFGGTALIACNPGYFWDDWVWRFQSPAQNIQISKELGIFWGGYLTNAINALAHPSLAMRVTALLGWVVAGAAAAYVLHRRRVLSRDDAFALFLIYTATHVAMVRFLTSVAMYNVYIASFWIGCACLSASSNERRNQLVSLPFFFFSFYLNSLIALYLAILVLFAARYASERVGGAATYIPQWGDVPSRVREWRVTLSAIVQATRAPLREFAAQHAALLALPLVFVLIKRLTHVKSMLYGDYNDIHSHALLSSFIGAFTIIRPVLRDYFAISSRGVPWPILVSCCLLCFLLLRVAPRKPTRTTLRASLAQAALGWILFAAAVYPYLVADKTPVLTSFYDSRNILPALVALALVLISFVNLLDLAFAKVAALRTIGRDLVLGYVIGASVGSGIVSGLDLWRDWIRQSAIMTFVRTHEAPLKDVRTFVFDDAAPRIGDRMLWNYEYTGSLVAVYHTKERLGISVDEYVNWPRSVQLIVNPGLRQRFNLDDYDFDKPHAIITVRNGVVPLTNLNTLSVVRSYLRGEAWRQRLGRYIDISMAFENVQADARVAQIFDIVQALDAYKRDHGQYPPTSAALEDGIPTHTLSPTERIGPPIVRGDIPGLFPDYMPRMTAMAPHPIGDPTYLYMSDGLDFKLVYADPPDFAYAKQAHPVLIDPMRPAYGTWTSGAKNW
ncbi:hypothetical protein [Trinickia acidisoli]|uniref:hypothetical protein n=1 Tax=Trinickia acidisoli TaxID=2767482 RepID=UPI001A8D508C|nr:hypothetical protein [Trinickia acidisoli]